MTREEAKEYIRDCLEHNEAEEIIEALDQEPCEDCVSRKELIDKLEIVDKMYGSDFYWEVRKIVDNLPSVRPMPKKGKWIKVSTKDKYDFLGQRVEVSDYKCSECGRRLYDICIYDSIEKYPYCHCGAKMEVE